ncbi:MAG: O-antigen ligase family protein, partial [Oscillospiraceae bacterium]
NKQIMTILPTAFENTDLTEPDSELDSSTMANDIKNLEKASDSKREQLQKYGIKQFKQNVLFGNGNVLYDYKNPENPEKGGQSASAHNFIIEFLVAFGIIGTLLFAAWFVFLFIPIIFNKKTSWWEKFDILILLFVIVSFGFVQQMLFNFIVLPIFAATIGALLTNKIDFICFKKTFKNKKIGNKQISK